MHKAFHKELVFPLTAEGIDRVSEAVMTFCVENGIDRKDSIRYRISLEDGLIAWKNKAIADEVRLTINNNIFGKSIQLEAKGDSCNPYENITGDFSEYINHLKVNMDQLPFWNYSKGTNQLSIHPKKTPLHPFLFLSLLLLIGFALGIIGNAFFPETMRNTILNTIINPVYDAFFRVISCIASPMILLSVTWGILGMGDTATLGRIGKRFFLTFVKYDVFIMLLCLPFFPLIGPVLSGSSSNSNQIQALIEMILDVFTSSIVAPLLSGNSLQLIVMGIVLGVTLLFLKKQTEIVVNLIEQLNLVIQTIMGYISKIIPVTIMLMMLRIIWTNQLDNILSTWSLVLCIVFLSMISLLTWVIRYSSKTHYPIKKLIPALIPLFLIGFTTSSSTASYSKCRETATNELGISESLTNFGLPLSIVMFKPCSMIRFILYSFYFAKVFQVECTIGWIIIALLISFLLSFAFPPVSGGAVAAFSLLFLQLGIPEEAVAIAITLYMLEDHIVTGLSVCQHPLLLGYLEQKTKE